MIEILLVGEEKELLSSLAEICRQTDKVASSIAFSEKAALASLENGSLKMVIIDEQMASGSGIKLAETIISRNPMINLAIISDRDAHDFHEATEGLGVLGQLPQSPKREDVEQLLQKLEAVLGMVK